MLHVAEHDPVVAFMLARYPQRASIQTLFYLGFDRLALTSTPGLRFWRLLGVGQGRVFDPHPDLQRSALFTVWDSLAALQHFEAQSRLMQRVRRQSEEVWSVQMLPVRWHGTWGGGDPFARFTPAPAPTPGPWVILTRATIYATKVRTFLAAVPLVAQHLLQQPTLLNSVGVGEAPFFYQATLSLWRTLPDMMAFAYGSAPHSEVVRRTRRENWYKEDLFVRFRPVAAQGTWDGVNPLAECNNAGDLGACTE